MATALPRTNSSPSASLRDWTLADVLKRVPKVPPHRICMDPTPGTATEDDVLHSKERLGVICELVDGTLVRKAMGAYESLLASEIIRLIGNFLDKMKLGRLTAPDGPTRLKPSKVRVPDVAFYSWDRLKKHFPKRGTTMKIGPDLAIEVLSPDNTKDEMDDKLRDYFGAKVRLVWHIDPKTKSARAYRSLKRFEDIPADGSLDGGDVLPGFALNLATLFASVEPPE
jgi:Uma2 family endonuclease